MEPIVVKTEMEESGEILLFYVDETGGTVEGSVTTIDNIDNMGVQIQEIPSNAYVMENVEDPVQESMDGVDTTPTTEQVLKDRWTPDEINRLLIFYTDNKQNFITGSTKKKHLWGIACKTMLSSKNPSACEMKLRNLKRKYAQVLISQQKGLQVNFPFLDLCHKAFYDDHLVNAMIKESLDQNDTRIVKMPFVSKPKEEPVMIVKSLNVNSKAGDSKVQLMLSLYLKYKKDFDKEYWRKDLWDKIATEIGEEDGDYWHKRFLNYKHHYLKMIIKRATDGPESIQWPYMSLYDQIFQNDMDFVRKYCPKTEDSKPVISVIPMFKPDDWNITEMTVLVKYYFDCYDEFQDPTVPDNFLWHEVGRLLDKKPDVCKNKYEEMRSEHLDKYIQGEYELRTRVPVCILFDNIISKDTELEMSKDGTGENNIWYSNELDELVRYFYDNIELFKDPICYFVCWASIAKKLKKSIKSCKLQWDDLTALYKSILEDKKENPDMQIDWRYIELFDRIFDYGMDTSLMFNFADLKEKEKKTESEKIAVKKINIDLDENVTQQEPWSDEGEYDERGFTKHTKRSFTQSKMFKILEYYQKNKDKFATTQKKKSLLWDALGKQLGLTSNECAQRFKSLKETYISYIEKEIEKPEIPIVWPYYSLCKKVFGYRALKAKLKNNKGPEDDWTAKEIKIIINYFGQNFHRILDNVDDSSQWYNVAREIGKSEVSCMMKFNELMKAYQKMKKMKTIDPNVKINWKYYALIDGIFMSKGQELALDHELSLEDGEHEQMEVLYEVDDRDFVEQDNNFTGQEEDYQCIIVIPEGQDITDMENAQIIIQNSDQITNTEGSTTEITPTNKWNKRTKKRLLILYLNFVRSKKGQEIKPVDMWKEISTKLNKTPLSCRKMFAKLKTNHREVKNDVNKKKTPYFTLLEKILAVKPKFAKMQKVLQEKTFKDVPLPTDKVQQALQYYLLHMEEFTSPRYEKKYIWTELANFICEPVTKVFNKVNYLKQFYNLETGEVAGENTLFSELLKEIITKETALNALAETDRVDVEDKTEYFWNDDEIEQLLIWYLANLDQFKNPKYVRKYLWLDVSNILKKSPLACSKKMAEIRTLYRNLVKENSEELNNWRFSSLCKEIYGTGKKEGNRDDDKV